MYPDKRRNSNGLTAAQQHVLDNAPTTPTTMHDILATTPQSPAISSKSRKSTITNAVRSLTYYKKLNAAIQGRDILYYKPIS